MSTRVHSRSLDRAESLHAHPTLRAAAKMIGVAASTLSRRPDVRPLARGERDLVLAPGEVLRLAAVYRKRSLNEVAADLIDHAGTYGAAEAERAEDAVEAFFAERSQSESVEEFLSQARRHLPPELYAEVERTVRAGGGERPAGIVGNVPRLAEEKPGRRRSPRANAAKQTPRTAAPRARKAAARTGRAKPRST